jgi:hypothetical protein
VKPVNRALRSVLVIGGFALIAAPIGASLLAEASNNRSVALLEEIRAAQERVRFQGRRVMTTPESTSVIDIHFDRPGRVKIEPVGKPPSGARRGFHLPGAGRGPRGRFSDPALILENYRLESRGAAAVAGRPADRYALLPRHAGRASYEFAVDQKTRFLLSFRAGAPDGAALYESRYESITFDPPALPEPPQKPEAPKQGERVRRVLRTRVAESDLRGVLPFAAWKPSWLPAGFRRRALDHYRIRDLGDSVMDSYTDGMTSLFLVQTGVANPAWRLFRDFLGLPAGPEGAEGDVVAHRIRHGSGTILDLTLEGTEVLIGGQVDPADLERIANSLVRLDE